MCKTMEKILVCEIAHELAREARIEEKQTKPSLLPDQECNLQAG